MNENNSRPVISIWSIVAVLTAFATFYLSTFSPFVLMLPVLYLASFFLPYRFERDAANIWGLRLLVYAGFAVLGRTPTGMPGYFVDAQAFTTAGLMAGGELVLQAFRRPPHGARFEPLLVTLSGIIFLIASNSFRDHVWMLAPLYMASVLFSLTDLRPRANSSTPLSSTLRAGVIIVAVVLGASLHQTLWANRGSIMSLGARLLSNQINAEQTAGVSDNPLLTSSFSQGASTARLLRIEGTLDDPHLRAASFDTYANGGWGPAISSRFSLLKPLPPALPKDTREETPDGVTRPRSQANAKITVLKDSGGVLFAPLNSWAIMPDNGQSFNWDRYQGPFATEEPPPVSYYVINSRLGRYDFQMEQGPLCVAPNRVQRARLLVVPQEIDPKVVRLARQITQDGKTQVEKASMIVDYLFRNIPYSLTFERGPGDPISDFVLNKRAAHCQYFASATAIMLRAVGIPARYATGYFAHESAEDGSTVVRGRDAHAWTEAYFDNIGWVTLDSTPAGGRADPAVSPSPWYEKWLEKAQDNFARIRAWFGNLTQLQIIGIILVILAFWGLERWRQTRKKARKAAAAVGTPPEFAPLARRFERLLSKRGVNPAPERPWSEAIPVEMQDEREWIDGYNRARFDRESHIEIEELERELQKLEK